ncbi:MAG: hypothetical protein JXA89_00330, partial [Anaerolineae bacterium]|nr:hypothetical protein [Anaerolineae bacterium]
SRREFIKGVGIAFAALMTSRCRLLAGQPVTPRDRVRDCWQRLDWLAEETQNARRTEQGEEARDRLAQDHQAALNELVISGDLAGDVADQVQTAFDAAVYHVWRSNAPITCYEPVLIDYKPTSSSQLANQARLLAQSDGLDPDTIALAQAAIARDVAFLNLSGDQVQALYDRLLKGAGDSYDFPSFEELELDVSSEALEAAQFLVDLLLVE